MMSSWGSDSTTMLAYIYATSLLPIKNKEVKRAFFGPLTGRVGIYLAVDSFIPPTLRVHTYLRIRVESNFPTKLDCIQERVARKVTE
ncbi:hypothetical protein BVRB_5g099560 [Beta vulgaris subsp. vulgaris]|nr:hypothetical protein BVRB_5g099560 [Beta vulgaris subsp. vulgaris]